MNKLKKGLVFCLMMAVLLSLAACRNNLVNEWENYTGPTDVYYTPPAESESEEPTEEVNDLTEYGIPDYWEEEIDDTIATVASTLEEADRYTAFFWYTDAHWSYGSQNSVAILQYLEEHTAVDYTNFGGDIVNTYEVDEQENVLQLDEWRAATLELTDHHSVVGNHDDDISKLEARSDLYEFLIAPEFKGQLNENNSFDYYVDDPSQNTRYVYLSTGFEETSASTLAFLVQTLNTAPKDWHIVLVSHIWFVYYDTAAPTVGEVPTYADSILKLADAYNNREKGSTDYDVPFDFSDGQAQIEFCMGGHTHVDFAFRTEGGIPVILTETDSYHTRGTSADEDSVTEASVNVIIADYDAGKIHVIRVGRGEDRIVSITQ